ncbi:MAG: hypothetical protein Q9168_002686 [Polycauliona sp. 1 TL-2023]
MLGDPGTHYRLIFVLINFSIQQSHLTLFFSQDPSTHTSHDHCTWAEVQNTFDGLPSDDFTVEIVLHKLYDDEDLWETSFELNTTDSTLPPNEGIGVAREEAGNEAHDKEKDLDSFLEGRAYVTDVLH